jgi:hypothetical protein
VPPRSRLQRFEIWAGRVGLVHWLLTVGVPGVVTAGVWLFTNLHSGSLLLTFSSLAVLTAAVLRIREGHWLTQLALPAPKPEPPLRLREASEAPNAAASVETPHRQRPNRAILEELYAKGVGLRERGVHANSTELARRGVERVTGYEVQRWIDEVTAALRPDLDLFAQWKRSEPRTVSLIGTALPEREQLLRKKLHRLKGMIERMP